MRRRRRGSAVRGALPLPSLGGAAGRAGLTLDPWQSRAAASLDGLAAALADPRRPPAGGLYLWGPVGRGKTWLLDAFFAAAPARGKKRLHFHAFFRDLHAAVQANRTAAHAFDAAVEDLLSGCDLVCFDELHFHDVGDAMLAGRLLRRLFDRGAMLVATSNYPPEGLLPNPLHHHLFAPTIELLRRQLQVLEVAGPVDYRSVAGGAASGFRSGALVRRGADAQLAALGLQRPVEGEATAIAVGTRTVTACRVDAGAVWFDFPDLCERATSGLDLLALAERFATWVVGAVPRLAARPADVQQRFVNLVDILHDRDVRLVLVCDVPPDALLAGPLLVPDGARAASRLRLLARPAPTGW